MSKQIKILNQMIKDTIKDYYRLAKINLDPEQQHCWDEWKECSGLLSGLLIWMGCLIQYEDELKITPKKRRTKK